MYINVGWKKLRLKEKGCEQCYIVKLTIPKYIYIILKQIIINK